MNKEYSFFVPGKPTAKGRHRSRIARSKAGKAFVTHYAPAETVEYENLVRMAASAAMQGEEPLSGPVHVEISAEMLIPASWSKKKQAEALGGKISPTSKPDADNIIKAIFDGMNAIAFADDSQVCRIVFSKKYGNQPGVTVLFCQA